MCKVFKKKCSAHALITDMDNTFLTSDLSSLSSKSFRLVANVDGEAQMTAEVEAFDELEVAIWGCCSLLWFPTEQWRLDEVEVATPAAAAAKIVCESWKKIRVK